MGVLFISGKCKHIPRHLLFLLWFSWRFEFAEVFAKPTIQKGIMLKFTCSPFG